VAAVLIVMVLFVLFQLVASTRTVTPAPTAAHTIEAVPHAAPPPAIAPAAVAPAAPEPPAAPATAAPVETATGTPTDDPSSRTHGHHKGAPAGSASGDLGEFKTTF